MHLDSHLDACRNVLHSPCTTSQNVVLIQLVVKAFCGNVKVSVETLMLSERQIDRSR